MRMEFGGRMWCIEHLTPQAGCSACWVEVCQRPEPIGIAVGVATGNLPPRPEPTDCRHEPPYPGLETVMLAISNPDLTCHAPTERCQIEEPHQITDCREWKESNAPSN